MHFLVETHHSPLAEIFKKTSPTLLHDCKDCSWDAWNFEIELRYRRQENIPVTDALSLVCLKKEERTFASQNSEWCKPDFNIQVLSYEHRFGEVSASKQRISQIHVLKNHLQMDGQAKGLSPKGIMGILESQVWPNLGG